MIYLHFSFEISIFVRFVQYFDTNFGKKKLKYFLDFAEISGSKFPLAHCLIIAIILSAPINLIFSKGTERRLCSLKSMHILNFSPCLTPKAIAGACCAMLSAGFVKMLKRELMSSNSAYILTRSSSSMNAGIRCMLREMWLGAGGVDPTRSGRCRRARHRRRAGLVAP